MKINLSILGKEGVEKELSFSSFPITIGRDPDCELFINDQRVSRFHARITKEGAQFRIVDLKSKNGTFINNDKISESILKTGDIIKIGELEVIFEVVDTESVAISEATFHIGAILKKSAASEKEKAKKAEEAQPTIKSKEKEGEKSSELKEAKKKRLLLPSLSPKIKVAIIAFLLIMLSAVVLKVVLKPSAKPSEPEKAPSVNVADVTTYPLPSKDSHGYFSGDKEYVDKVRFSFISQEGRATLYYMPGDVDQDGEVVVYINEKKVDQAPLCPNSWGELKKVEIQTEVLKPVGQENILAFEQTNPASNLEQWGVRNVRVEFKVIPEPDVKKAEELFSKAKKLAELKNVSDENLYRASSTLREALDYLEKLRPHPSLYQEIQSFLQKVEDELQMEFEQLKFSYQKSYKIGDYQRAAQILNSIVRKFPDENDPRHVFAAEELEKPVPE